MAINRRALLRALGPAVAFPYLLRSSPLHAAAVTIKKAGGPVQLGASQPGGQSRVALSAFNGNEYVAGWINTRSSTDARAFAQKRHRKGTAISDPIQMGGGPLTDGIVALNIATVAFPNGTSLIFFAAQRNGGNPSDSFDIFVQRMSASFHKVGNPISVNTTLASAQGAVFATRLKNGNVQVVWESSAADFFSSTIKGRIFQPNGQPASPERTVIRQTTGFNTPKALVPGPNGGSLLSYTRIFSNAAAAAKDIPLWQKDVQPLKADGSPSGNPIVLDTAKADRPFGAPGLMWTNPNSPDGSIFYLMHTSTGNVSEFHRWEIEGAPPHDKRILNLRVDPFYQGPPLGVEFDYDGVDYDFIAVVTKTINGLNTLEGMLARTDGAVVTRLTLGPFPRQFLAASAGVAMFPSPGMVEYLTGFANGDDATHEDAFVQRLVIGDE